jgi:hypothetical protein
MRQRFNLQYTPVVGELPALIRLQSFKPQTVPSPETVLIVNRCLIGDFVVWLPAISDFLREHPEAQVDLLVSPTIAPLARKVRGVRSVYVARSVFGRPTELSGSDPALAPSYDLVVVLPLSGPARTECKRCFTLYCPHAPNCIGKIEVEKVADACMKILSTAVVSLNG